MKGKKLLKVLGMLLATSMLLSACGQSASRQPASETAKSEAEEKTEEKTDETPAQSETEAEKDYSDVDIEVFFATSWVNVEPSGEDVFAEYIGETFGGNWKMTIASEGETELITRMASGDEPDLILFANSNQMNLLYKEGVLLDDWTPYQDQIPTYLASMTDMQREFYTTADGKLKAVSYAPGDQLWTFMIRRDWLDNLNLEMPATVEEMLDVMRAFTFEDPDGNGKDDTYGFTAAGGGGIGDVRNLLLLFDHPNLYIQDGEVTNALVEGTYKDYLDLAKTIVNEGLINPDWYTIGWEDRKPSLYQGAYGIVYYPPHALFSETISKMSLEGEAADAIADQWAVMDLIGKSAPKQAISESTLTVSAACAEDPLKMEVICNFLEGCGEVNDQFANVRSGMFLYGEGAVGEGERGYEIGDGTYTTWTEYKDPSPSAEMREYLKTYGWQNWGMLINHNAGGQFARTTKEPSYWFLKSLEMTSEVAERETYSNEYQLYSPDATLSTELDDKLNQYATQYIMGEVDEDSYHAFVTDWLADGGQEYLDAAKEQLTALGFME